MKGLLVFMLLIMLCVVSSNLLAADYSTERSYFYESSNSGYNGQYFDLSKPLYLPKYGSKWTSNDDWGSAQAGTYSYQNHVGQLGCAFTTHEMEFTITTDGRFTSQSDSTKYREFYIAILPRCRSMDNKITDGNYYGAGGETTYRVGPDGINTSISDTDRVPNTRDSGNILTFKVPAMPIDNYCINIGPGTNYKWVSRFWLDVLVCMDELTSSDLQHLAENDDYTAKIYISWRCTDPDCTDSRHSGSYALVLSGHYGGGSFSYDPMMMYVNPTAESRNLDLQTILSSNSPEVQSKIADLKVYCKRRDSNWLNNLFIFMSSSSDYAVSGDHFALKGVSAGNSGYTIPFEVVVKNSRTADKSFDGTGVLTNRKSDCLDVSAFSQYSQGRMMEQTYSVFMESEVYIDFGDLSVPERNNVVTTYPDDLYETNIYYYIIYTDTKLN